MSFELLLYLYNVRLSNWIQRKPEHERCAALTCCSRDLMGPLPQHYEFTISIRRRGIGKSRIQYSNRRAKRRNPTSLSCIHH
jgi:hypothetical protein